MPIALSYSRLSDFTTCPYKFKSKYLDKTYPDESGNVAFEKGKIVHKQLEQYVLHKKNPKGEPPVLGIIAKNAKSMLDSLCSDPTTVFPELQIAVDMNWEECTWFAPAHVVKYRAIVDLLRFNGDTLYIIDYKTGKFADYSDSPTSQLRLTATIFFSLYPGINKIVSAYLYVEHKQTVQVVFLRDELEKMKSDFDAAYQMVQDEEDFAPTKHQYCMWCLVNDCPIKGNK